MLRYFVFRTPLQEIIIANTLYYDMVWTEYQYEKELTTTEMQEKVHVDENAQACCTPRVARRAT